MSDRDPTSVAWGERERALLRAGLQEEPSEASLRAAEQALGLAPVAAGSAAGDRGLAPGKLPSAGRVAASGIAPAAPALVATVLLAAIGATFYATRPARVQDVQGPPPRASIPPPVAEAASGAAGVAALGGGAAPGASTAIIADPATPGVANRPATPIGRFHDRSSNPRPGPSAADRAGNALESEVALVDRARALAASGHSSSALAALDEHDRRYPGGVLAEEADLLRVEAAAALGDEVGAAVLARRFLARHPASVHSATVRSVLGGKAP